MSIPKVVTPREITHLSTCEVLVYFNNLSGISLEGYASKAYELFGAEQNVESGPTGQCYVIPLYPDPKDATKYVEEFIEYAKLHPRNRFMVTRMIDVSKQKIMYPNVYLCQGIEFSLSLLFHEAMYVENITLPLEWKLEIADAYRRIGVDLSKEMRDFFKIDVPDVITIDILQELCDTYSYRIGAGIHKYLPHIRVRYVIDEDKFGYTTFGNFFFYQGSMYVFDHDEQYVDKHNAGVVHAVFFDECEGHGYAHEVIFAGVLTPYIDDRGDSVYTGDAVMVDILNEKYIYGVQPISPYGYNDYGIVLDNHCLPLSDCHKIVRVGTVLYNLPKEQEWDMLRFIEQRSSELQGYYGHCPSSEENLRHVRFTPNFFDNEIIYILLDNSRNDDFNWRNNEL